MQGKLAADILPRTSGTIPVLGLASDDEELIEHAKKLFQQAREDFAHYEHVEIGYNYRMSNILAAIGRGQLRVLDKRVKRKREIFDYYRAALGDVPGLSFMPEPEWPRASRWLTVMLVIPEEFGAEREMIRLALERERSWEKETITKREVISHGAYYRRAGIGH